MPSRPHGGRLVEVRVVGAWSFSGTRLRSMFMAGETPPKEFMRPEVSQTILGFTRPFVE